MHESILQHGQDLKNEQWIIEPIANMVISLSVMDTGFKRYMQIENSEHKNNTREVLQLSIVDHFENCCKYGEDIISALYSGEEYRSRINIVKSWHEKLNYVPQRINIQKKIVNTLYQKKKYYLD